MFLLNLLLALAWALMSGSLTSESFLMGFVVGYILLWLLSGARGPTRYFKRVVQALGLLLFFVKELAKANVRVAYEVITPTLYARPGVVAVPLDIQSDGAITLLANLVTLTPGTLCLDVSTDRRVMYIHTMYVDDVEKFRREIKQGFERRIQELME